MTKALPRHQLAATALVLCCAVSGCEGFFRAEDNAATVAPEPAPIESAPAPVDDKTAEAPPPKPLAKPAAPLSAPVQSALLAPPPTPTVVLRLNGLSMAQTEAEFGRPAVEADRAPAKVWQYRSGDCALDVYFYLDMARNGFYALHHDAKRGDSADETCIRVVQEAGRVR